MISLISETSQITLCSLSDLHDYLLNILHVVQYTIFVLEPVVVCEWISSLLKVYSERKSIVSFSQWLLSYVMHEWKQHESN